MSPSTIEDSDHQSLQDIEEDKATTIRQPSPDFSDHDVSDIERDEHPGDYSTRMEELFEDGEDGADFREKDDVNEEDDEEGFLYTGIDADVPTGYRERLRDVLGSELSDDDELEAHEATRSLFNDDAARIPSNDEPLEHRDVLSDHTPSASSIGPATPQRIGSPGVNGMSSNITRPFLHPTVSRLRSSPRPSQLPSNGSVATQHSHLHEGASPSPSHFSAMSRMSSTSNLHTASSSGDQKVDTISSSHREVFKWTELRNITQRMFTSPTQKASTVLRSPTLGSPTVLAANGLVCIGTETGRICVFDFRQTLKCICGDDSSAKTVGPVTALALSHDHTYVASGHVTGYIQIFDLKTPQTPARLLPPTTLAAVASGRKEGHLQGFRIVRVGFIAGRHTAIVSVDDHGLAFFHRLGKVLFVEASDILRILGKYPQDETSPAPRTSLPSASTPKTSLSIPDTSLPRSQKSRHTILDMMPLPLGTSPHATDAYNVIALLTPTKLVVVGLKPTPRTWFKCPREVDEGGSWRSKSKWKGNLAWFPSVLTSSTSLSNFDKRSSAGVPEQLVPTTPMLVYTWGNALRLIRVAESRTKEAYRNPRTGKTTEIEVGRIVYHDAGRWLAESDILAVQWLNANQVIVVTTATLDVYDIHISKLVERVQFDGLSLLSPTLGSTVNGSVSYLDSASDVGHSLRVYKGKIFVLSREHLRVGMLLTWADQILSFVQDGNFLNAIELTRSYYVGEAPGNRNGLPDDINLCKELLGGKMRDLLVASARYAFSEDRMTDGTHVTPDGRGVDRTSLFEGLVAVTCRACIALDDFEFLFEDLFQQYDDTGISKIYLQQLEHFILNNEIRFVPPRITQRLVASHEEDSRPDYVESIIWHIDPTCLDINQAIILCRRYHLYDALIYIYTQALHDCVAPIVELLGLIRKVQQYRKYQESKDVDDTELGGDVTMEPVIMNAYKIYPYLSNVWSGLSYPSGQPLAADEAFQAKKKVYEFLFLGHSTVWPTGEGAKLVLTSDEDSGVEPTYPYARQLLRFDAESFLHSLDIAFEDSYLTDEGPSRIIIVRILLETLSSGDLPPADKTFVNIFVARNIPKYPQYLPAVSSTLAPSAFAPGTLHGILVGLAEDPDPDTREDRQLAAEYLLSVYNPRESELFIDLFKTAGFYRILRSWHRREKQWAPLLSTFLVDPALRPSEIFHSIDGVLAVSTRASKGTLLPELLDTISSALPRLLRASIARTAILIDKYMPDLHELALQNLDENADNHRLLYLRRLLGSPQLEDSDENIEPLASAPSSKLSSPLRQLYVSLQCQYNPEKVIEALKYLPPDSLDWEQVQLTCEANEVYHAVMWAANRRGDPQGALAKAETYQKRLTLKMVQELAPASQSIGDIHHDTESLKSIAQTGLTICLEHSYSTSEIEVPLEDIWFRLLSSQINCVQMLSGYRNDSEDSGRDANDLQEHVLTTLRALVQTTFTSLVSISAAHTVSFPRLFRRLVNSAPTSTNTQYNEFRIILSGMLESYRSDGDMLVITKHLVDRDLFEAISDVARERARGWAPVSATCAYCQTPLIGHAQSESSHPHSLGIISFKEIVVSRTGSTYHNRCSPPDA